MGLRLAGYGKSFEFIVSDSSAYPGKSSLNTQYVALHYFKHLPVNLNPLMMEDPWFSDTEFSSKKKAGTYRIFTLGALNYPGISLRRSPDQLFRAFLI